MYETTDKPSVAEQYLVATNSSDLRVEADTRGAADVLIAAGWSRGGLDGALERLKGEWDAAAKPRRPLPRLVKALEGYIRQEDIAAEAEANRKGERWSSPGSLADRARKRADAWYAGELRLLAQSLKSREQVWTHLAPWLAHKGIAADVGAEALLHWLDPTCPHCVKGLKKVPDQPALSAKVCNRCHGTGEKPRPAGAGRVLSFLDDRVSHSQQKLRRRLRHR